MVSLLWLRFRLWLGFRFATRISAAMGWSYRVARAFWLPVVVFLAATAFLIWLGEKLGPASNDPLFHWWKLAAQWVVPLVVVLLILRMALQARKRIVVGDFLDYRQSGKGKSLPGLGNLLVTKLMRFRDLYRTVADQPARDIGLDRPQIATDRAIVATVKVEDVGDFGAVSSDASVKVGVLEIPIGFLFTLFSRLVRGPRISGGVHDRVDGPTLVAQLVGAGASYGWRIDDPAPLLHGDRKKERDVDDMATELACRIFTDLALSGSVNWRATFRFSEGLRKYRNRLSSRRERLRMLRQAERNFGEALAADQTYGLAYYSYYNLGLVYHELNHLEAAERAFEEAIERFPVRWEAVYALAWTRFRHAERDLSLEGAPPEDRAAEQLYLRGVITLCERVIELQSFTRRQRLLPSLGGAIALAKAYDLKGSAERRLQMYAAAVESRGSAVRYSWWALTLQNFGVSRPTSMRSLAVSCLRDLAVAYQDEQEIGPRDRARELVFKRAEAVFLTALALDHSDPRLRFELGDIYSRWGRPDRAADEWECAFRIRPSLRTIWLGEKDGAFVDRRLASARLKEARDLRANGQHFQALEQAEESIRLDPFSAAGHMELALIHFEISDMERARSAWDAALLLNPDDPGIYWQLGMCHWRLAQDAPDSDRMGEELSLAGEYLLTAAERYGSQNSEAKAACHYWLAMLYFAQENYVKAISELRVVDAGGFGRLVVNLRLGEAFLTVGRYDEGITRLHIAINLGREARRVHNDAQEMLGAGLGESLSLNEALAWAHCRLASGYIERDIDLPAAIRELGKAQRYAHGIEDPAAKVKWEAECADCEGWALYKQWMQYHEGDAGGPIPLLEHALSLGAGERAHYHLAQAYIGYAESFDDEREAALLLRRAEAHCQHVRELDLRNVYREQVVALRLQIEEMRHRNGGPGAPAGDPANLAH